MGLLIFFSFSTVGQIQITFPTSRAVFQRNNSNQCSIYIAGNYSQHIDRVDARLVARPLSPTQGTTTPWTTIQSNPSGGFFYGSMTVNGGWYNIEVRGYLEGQLLFASSIQRIGVGEVFVVAGQSNATGDDALIATNNYGRSAVDDRVSTVNYQDNPLNTYAMMNLPNLSFSHLDSTFRISPFGSSAWHWGILGDSLAKKLNVPIAFFNAGWSGSAVGAWKATALSTTATPQGFITYPAGMPYGHLRQALNFYAAQYGVRAVLWHQGETDNWDETTQNNYGDALKTVIQSSRSHAGKANLAWVVARASRVKGFSAVNSRIWQPVINAQNDVIGVNIGSPNFVANVWAGPQTDPLVGPGIRTMPDSIHFETANGHNLHAKAWNQALNSSFFSSSTPYSAIPPIQTSVTCASANTLSISVLVGYPSIAWANDAQALNYIAQGIYSVTVGNGSYTVRAKDGTGNTLLSPVLNVPNGFTGIIPVESTMTGSWSAAGTWVCGRVPTASDWVTIKPGHTVTIPSSYNALNKKLFLKGNLSFSLSGGLSN
jgi:hypothetical protein